MKSGVERVSQECRKRVGTWWRVVRGWWLERSRSVAVLDPDDSSVTINKRLLRRIMKRGLGENKILVFRYGDSFAFAFNPKGVKMEETQSTCLSYNERLGCYGFETLRPTVAYMLFELGRENKPLVVDVEERALESVGWIYIFRVR